MNLTEHEMYRFADKTRIRDDGCIEWMGRRSPDGYGRVTIRNRRFQAHRVSYEHHVGQIPTGMQIDHLCRNRACVRPDHLESVTQRENIARSSTRSAHMVRTDQCKFGHADVRVNKHGHRYCAECQRIKHAEYTAARKQLGLSSKQWWNLTPDERRRTLASPL